MGCYKDGSASNRRFRQDKRCVALVIVVAIILIAAVAAFVFWSCFYSHAEPPSAAEVEAQRKRLAAEKELPMLSSSNSSMIIITNFTTEGPVTTIMVDNGDLPWKDYAGKWKLERTEHMEDYFCAVGLPWLLCKAAAMVTLYNTIKVEGKRIRMQVTSAFQNEPEYEHIIDGPETFMHVNHHDYRAKTTWQDGKLIVQTGPSLDGQLKPQRTIREIINGEMKQIMEVGDDAFGVQYYVKYED